MEVADRAAEERADLAPAPADRAAGPRQPDADVQLPERSPDAARNAELESRDDAARADDPRELAERCCRVTDVAQEVGEGQRVELAVGERQRHRTRLDELDGPVHTPPCLR